MLLGPSVGKLADLLLETANHSVWVIAELKLSPDGNY